MGKKLQDFKIHKPYENKHDAGWRGCGIPVSGFFRLYMCGLIAILYCFFSVCHATQMSDKNSVSQTKLEPYFLNHGFFVRIAGNIAMGPGALSIHEKAFEGETYSNAQSKNTFNLANDGRFAYQGSLSYVHSNNFGLEVKYVFLGKQCQIGVNGISVNDQERGRYAGDYYGMNLNYYLPINDKKQYLYFSLGGGNLKTSLTTSSAQVFGSSKTSKASQSEFALLTGGGVRFKINELLGFDVELFRLTPTKHGVFNSGIYNNAYNVISIGLSYKCY